jgi:hypothetical protein
MRRYLALAAMVLAVTPAWAFDANKLGQGGSLPLSDLDGLINQSAKLKGEVNAALAKSKRAADSVVCGGNRFPREWRHLGAARAAPYACNFNGKWLVIDATVTVSGPNGRIYDTITPAAMHDADKLTETHPTWKWTDKAPD